MHSPTERLQLFFMAVALLLRNMWVWTHLNKLAEGHGQQLTLHLENCASNGCSIGSFTKSSNNTTTKLHLTSNEHHTPNLELLNELILRSNKFLYCISAADSEVK